MKVHELISELQKYPADAREVLKREEFDFQQMKKDLLAEWKDQLW